MNGKPVELGTARLKPEAAPLEPDLPDQPVPAPKEVNLSPAQVVQLRDQIVEKLYSVFDPEIPVNIYELGLIYDIIVKPDGFVNILMTLTTPACPVAGALPAEVEQKVRSVPNVTAARADLVWDPPWDKSRMSEAAKLQLGIDD